jgi:hypothetical protein
MHFTKALQLLALKEVNAEHPSEDFQWRKLQRWYSKTFATPLHLVEDIPLYDIVRVYWEERYEGLEEAELHLEMEAAVKTDAELEAEAIKKAEDDLYTKKFADGVEKEAAEQNKEKAKRLQKTREEMISKAEADRKATENLFKALGDCSDILEKAVTKPKARRTPGLASLPSVGADLEDFSLDFTELDDDQQEP